MGIYQLLDRAPKGRNEEGMSFPMEWVRRKDEYESAGERVRAHRDLTWPRSP